MILDDNTALRYEAALVGSMLLGADMAAKIASHASPSEFSGGATRALYEAAWTANMSGKPFELLDAAELLRQRGDVADPEGYLESAMAIAPYAENVALYADEVRAWAKLKRTRQAVHDAVMATTAAPELVSRLAEICADSGSAAPEAQKLTSVLTSYYDAKGETRQELRINTGFTRLDALLKGMAATNMVVIAARPGVGKSAFALEIARGAAAEGHTVLIYSMEMAGSELAERLISRTAALPMDELIELSPASSAETWQRVSGACGRLSALPIYINDSPKVTTSRIRAEARTVRAELVIVDFLTLMQTDRRYDNRNLEVGALSRELKMLAQELKIPVVALSQLNRGKDDTDRPTLRDLRDSGEIEQNANKVLFLWRCDADDENIISVTVAKNRRGRLGSVIMEFDGKYMSFTETEREAVKPRKRRRAYDDD